MNQTHPLVDAYLERLDGLLQGTDAATRAEVVLGVRDHLRDRLGDGTVAGDSADDTQVRAALAELGTPEQVADEAYAGGGGAPSPSSPSRTDRRWLPVTVMALGALVLAMLALLAATGPGMFEALIPLVYPPFWPVLVVLVVAAKGWSAREKWVLVTALPAACLLVAVVTHLAWSVSTSAGPIASIAALVVAVVSGAAVLVVLGRRGLARAH